MKKSIKCLLIAVLFAVPVQAQETEVKITLNEQFFEALLEAVFTNLDEPSVPISLGASNIATEARARDARNAASISLHPQTVSRFSELSTHYSSCDESVRLKREVEGVR
ncbi:MAG: hypothetical protein OEQ28_14800, partial [Acidobacteriota bacterium]|nr:hypothetical protein [Acidobacteriota bacterium]